MPPCRPGYHVYSFKPDGHITCTMCGYTSRQTLHITERTESQKRAQEFLEDLYFLVNESCGNCGNKPSYRPKPTTVGRNDIPRCGKCRLRAARRNGVDI